MRPTFEYNGQPVRAAGLLICTRNRGRDLYLFNRYKGRYEDTGGKTDGCDQDALDTAVREAAEETNGKIFSYDHTLEDCRRCLYHHMPETLFYNPRSKYLLFKVCVDPSILSLSMTRFGKEEKTDWGILQHYFQWQTTIPAYIHPRLHGLSTPLCCR
jgi:8-oxo-dGTP pyrophosphatase MutT (NUDIX family)